jgi:hypothetical protein
MAVDKHALAGGKRHLAPWADRENLSPDALIDLGHVDLMPCPPPTRRTPRRKPPGSGDGCPPKRRAGRRARRLVTAMPRMKACISLRYRRFSGTNGQQPVQMCRVPVPAKPVRRVAFVGVLRRVAGIGDRDLRGVQCQRPGDIMGRGQGLTAQRRPACNRTVRPVGQRVDPDKPRAPMAQPDRAQRLVPARRDRAGPASPASRAPQPRRRTPASRASSQLTTPPPCAAC